MTVWSSTLFMVHLVPFVCPTFSSNFIFHLEDLYGRDAAKDLMRTDVGPNGSFGGGGHEPRQSTSTDPIVFVHGYTDTAASFGAVREFLQLQGFSEADLYGTTYGAWDARGGRTLHTGMACAYVRNVRRLINAVHLFTNRSVNVVGVSMGGPVSRKAILGGKCVDTGESLGQPYSSLVSNYIGVAGVQRGARFCENSTEPACNNVFGMRCNSTFYKDLNRKSSYEGRRRAVIQSADDAYIGYAFCGGHVSEFAGATAVLTYHGYNHGPAIANSHHAQYLLLTGQIGA